MMNKLLKSQLSILLLFLLSGGLLSMGLKFELNWDFANYHYYNPWAFLNNRIGFDVAVAGINAFFNPMVDLPLYALIKYFNDCPNFIYFMQGLWSGALAFVLYKISCLFFDQNTINGKYSIFAVLLLGMSGYAVFFQIGTSTNEIMVASLIMLSLYLLLREIFTLKTGRNKIFFVAGLLAGMALGLKLTVAMYCVALGLTLIVFAQKLQKPWGNILFFGLGGLLGFLLLDGFWLWQMWQRFGNPIFPYGNEWFKSEFFEIRNYNDNRFIPKTMAEFWLLPFYWAFNSHRLDGNVIVIDYRWAILVISLILVMIKYVYQKTKINLGVMFVFCYTLISYFIWIRLSAVGRYMIPMELCAAILMVKAVWYLLPLKVKWQSLYWQIVSALAFVMMLTPVFSQIWGCRDCVVDRKLFNSFVAVQGVKIPDNTLLMFYNYPSAALLPYFSRMAENIKGVSISQKNFMTENNSKDMFNANPYWAKMKAEMIENHQGLKVAIIAVEDDEAIATMQQDDPLLKNMICRRQRSNIIPSYHFCVAADKVKEIFE